MIASLIRLMFSIPGMPTPDRPGWSCTYLNENDPSSGIICLPATSGAGP
jgi:hypothetical protein